MRVAGTCYNRRDTSGSIEVIPDSRRMFRMACYNRRDTSGSIEVKT